jgi:hypothetical protein
MSEPPPPVPALPLGYAYDDSSQRPGIITAIGVISIIVGSLSIVGSGLSGLYGFGMMMVAQVSQAMATASANAPAPAATGPATSPTMDAGVEPPVDPAMGLDADARGVIVNVVAGLSNLNADRQKQLDTLLAYRGARVFAFANQPVTVKGVQARITKYGTMPSPDASKPGADFFLTAWGTVEIYDDHAVFRSEGSEPFSISAGQPALGAPMTRRQAADVIVTKVQGMASINEKQADALRELIASPAQNIIQDYASPGSEVTMAEVLDDGSLWVGFTNGDVDIDAAGKVTNSSQYSAGGGGAGWTGPTLNISRTATTVVMLEAMASMGLAVYLLVIGILTLRQSLRARMLHWVYVWIKIPLAIACAWAWAAVVESMSSGAAAPVAWIGAIAALGAGAYPVALIFALNTRSVKDYYATGKV